MFQLIITIISIALASAAALISINYTPWWASGLAEAEAGVRTALRKLETAYIVTSRTTSAAALDPTADSDGGLMSLYGPVIGFKPGAPKGYQWVYGKQSAAGLYANTHYFCLAPSSAEGPRNESAARAIGRAIGGFSTEQAILATTCGATAAEDVSGETVRPTLTFYVKPLPDVGL